MKKDKKNYVLKVKYSLVETTKSGERKVFDRKINKNIIPENKIHVLDKIKSFEDKLYNKQYSYKNPLERLWGYIVNYSERCKKTYYSMLST